MNVDIQKALQDWERKYNLNHVNRAYGEQYHRIVSANEIMDLCNRIAQTAQEQLNELAKLIPDCYYMDPPDGGATSLQEQFRRAMEDASLLRFIESQGDGSGWVARDSTTGRGYRVHNSARSTLSLRDAIKAYADTFASEPEQTGNTCQFRRGKSNHIGSCDNCSGTGFEPEGGRDAK